MPERSQNAYDAVIIGAGISGLVCGCYLAKAGKKVLIVEQHYKPGGYCTSFKRKGFTFDAAAHSFGGFRDGGFLKKIFTEFELEGELEIGRYQPSDVIKTPKHRVGIYGQLDETLDNFQKAFPHERNGLKSFFHDLSTPNPAFFASLRKITFSDLLSRYVTDTSLKLILAFPLFGNGGQPPSLLSAFVGAKIYSEFLLDGGYYPKGGMQKIPDMLARRFEQYGGEMRLNCSVKKISINNKHCRGVITEENEIIQAHKVVSNCDATFTFMELIGREHLPDLFAKMLSNMTPSLSMFILYLGLKETNSLFDDIYPGSNIWILNSSSIEDIYAYAQSGDIKKEMDSFMLRLSPDSKTLLAFVAAPYQDRVFWKNSKIDLQSYFIDQIVKYVDRDLYNRMCYSEAATPATLYDYTGNYKGAAYGWAATLSQSFVQNLRKPSFIENLFLSGHWTTYAQGIPGVIYMGYDTARHILRAKT